MPGGADTLWTYRTRIGRPASLHMGIGGANFKMKGEQNQPDG